MKIKSILWKSIVVIIILLVLFKEIKSLIEEWGFYTKSQVVSTEILGVNVEYVKSTAYRFHYNLLYKKGDVYDTIKFVKAGTYLQKELPSETELLNNKFWIRYLPVDGFVQEGQDNRVIISDEIHAVDWHPLLGSISKLVFLAFALIFYNWFNSKK